MAESDIGWWGAPEDDGAEMELTYDKERDGALSPQQASPLLNRRSNPVAEACLKTREALETRVDELATRVDEALAADDQAESEGRALVAELLAGKMLVDDVSGADVAAGSGADRAADEPLGAGIDRLLVRDDVVGKMKES